MTSITLFKVAGSADLLSHGIEEVASREALQARLNDVIESGDRALLYVNNHIFSVVPDDNDEEKAHVIGPNFDHSERPGVLALRMWNAADVTPGR